MCIQQNLMLQLKKLIHTSNKHASNLNSQTKKYCIFISALVQIKFIFYKIVDTTKKILEFQTIVERLIKIRKYVKS